MTAKMPRCCCIGPTKPCIGSKSRIVRPLSATWSVRGSGRIDAATTRIETPLRWNSWPRAMLDRIPVNGGGRSTLQILMPMIVNDHESTQVADSPRLPSWPHLRRGAAGCVVVPDQGHYRRWSCHGRSAAAARAKSSASRPDPGYYVGSAVIGTGSAAAMSGFRAIGPRPAARISLGRPSWVRQATAGA